jgi:hypothetical protein
MGDGCAISNSKGIYATNISIKGLNSFCFPKQYAAYSIGIAYTRAAGIAGRNPHAGQIDAKANRRDG